MQENVVELCHHQEHVHWDMEKIHCTIATGTAPQLQAVMDMKGELRGIKVYQTHSYKVVICKKARHWLNLSLFININLVRIHLMYAPDRKILSVYATIWPNS